MGLRYKKLSGKLSFKPLIIIRFNKCLMTNHDRFYFYTVNSVFKSFFYHGSPLVNIVLFLLSLEVFKTRLLVIGFHTLIKNVSFSFPTDVGFYNSLYSGSSIVGGTRSPLRSMWDLTIHPHRGSVSSLTHHPVFGSGTICNIEGGWIVRSHIGWIGK